MKPNVFNYRRPASPEDAFSESLAYVVNLFPDVGQRFVDRIAALAGEDGDYFGKFQEAEFIAHEFPDGHYVSRPDVKLSCTKRTIWFENKLDAPLSIDQMQRHARLAEGDKSCSLVFVSNLVHERAELAALPGYVHPTNSAHYVWVDLLPAFEAGGDAIRNQILSDFRAALKKDGVVGRRIKGAADSLYKMHSDAAHLALSHLGELMREVGFRVARKTRAEDTLRTYPVRFREYPLLNPRFRATAAWLENGPDVDCLELTVISDGRRANLDGRLQTFESTAECGFWPDWFENGYRYHGWFILPVHFLGRDERTTVDYQKLRAPLQRLLAFLRTV